MPGLRAPSNYSLEPPRHPLLLVNSKEPYNAEPHRSALASSYVTPVELFYKRNHGPIPIVDHIDKSDFHFFNFLEIIETHCKCILRFNHRFDRQSQGAVHERYHCAGNRRTSMSKNRKVKGVGWNIAAIGNAIWGGAKLADLLELIGIPKLSRVSQLGGKHVEFISIDKCKEENGGPYKASIPLSMATNPEADVLLAYEMNGEPLNRDHGYPLRVIVPGVIGARSVKWLDSINIIAEECQARQKLSGFFMQKDYKMFPPSVNWDNIDWSTRRPQMDFPVQSVICSLDDTNTLNPGKITIKGYSVSGGGRGIERVDLSIDGGKTWVEAFKHQKPGDLYTSDGESSDKWDWVLFEAEANIPESTEIVVKAVDIAGNVQPENVEVIWDLRGILNNSWHRVHVQIDTSKI
ncbi:sulfite oxidase [Striga asiatica]|uniref:Sulfite oxidase n=1 Tax=Striga asiatica TaxID=4170 RepID=A0A5A7PFL3_STRAF|nr:sulfite oxidase [Striga asiatica]